jgi:sulfate adenylyltransferase subunit 1
MVTGASTANLAVILVDARHGVVEQTCRHSFIANLLRIQHIVVAVNKMDLVNYSQEKFDEIKKNFTDFASRLDNIVDVTFIPISALNGDNVVEKSKNMDWYQGPTFLYHLETVYIGSDANHVDARFPVQWVIRPHSDKYHDFRGYAGRVAGGVFKPGDEVTVQPSGFSSKIKTIHTMDGDVDEAYFPMSVAMTLEDNIDIGRGDMIVKQNNPPKVTQDIDAMICWFSREKSLQARGKYILRQSTRETKAMVKEINYKVNINTLHKVDGDLNIALNDIGRIQIRTASPVIFDSYRRNRNTGSFILVDEFSNQTVAAGMII